MHVQLQHVEMAEETETHTLTAQVEKAVGAIQYLPSPNLSAPTSQRDSNDSGSGSRKPVTGFVHNLL